MLICHSCCHEGSAGPLSIYVLLKSNLHALDETKKETELRIRLDSSRFIALETQSQNLQYTVPFQLSWAKVWAMVWWADRGHDMIKHHPINQEEHEGCICRINMYMGVVNIKERKLGSTTVRYFTVLLYS